MKKYAVMGNPIAHSRSPEIHLMFAEQVGTRLSYERILVEPGRFRSAVADFVAAGGLGLNITLPLKEAAFSLAVEHTGRALAAGAVNTLMHTADGWFGDNTDGPGLVNDIVVNQGFEIAGRRVLLVGAGGAARGVLGPLLEAGPELVTLANRTAARAETLATQFSASGNVRAIPLERLAGRSFDLVINATSAGLSGGYPELPGVLYAPGSLAYDMVYGAGARPFLERARVSGATMTVDGLGMLVEQAAESFWLWHGRRVNTAPVIAALRQAD